MDLEIGMHFTIRWQKLTLLLMMDDHMSTLIWISREDVAHQLKQRTAEECREHYATYYLQGNIGKGKQSF